MTASTAFLESVESTDGFTERDIASVGNTGFGWLSPRISFSTDFAQIDRGSPGKDETRPKHIEYSTEFEFCMSISNLESPLNGAPADEIFSKGKLLPLHLLPSRIQIVKELAAALEDEVDIPSAERSCESSACPSPLFIHPLKSASYPPAGCGASSPSASRAPTCTSTWKDLFGLGKGKIQGQGGRSRGKQSFNLVRLLFRRSSSDLSKTANGNSEHPSSLSPVSLSVLDAPEERPVPIAGTLRAALSEENGEPNASNSAGTSCLGKSSHRRTASANSTGSQQKGNSGRIVLKNLERCSRNCSKGSEQGRQRESWRPGGGDKGGSFASSVRVAPVLNVPMCMSPVRETKSAMTGLRKLLIGKKCNLQKVSWTCPGGAV